MISRTCNVCGGTFSEVFFRSRGDKSSCHKPTCIGCELTRRTDEKRCNRPLKKAQAAVLTHTPKLMKRGLISSAQELITRYGWNAQEMAQDIAHAFADACPYCREKFDTMPHGLGDVTLDIVDPENPPYYKTNVQWVCMTCNRAKARTPPEIWSEKLAMWAEWRRRQDAMQNDPWFGTLFAGQQVAGQSSMF